MNGVRSSLLILAIGAGMAVLTGLPGLVSGYLQFVVASVAFVAIAVLAVSQLAGLTGIWSMGHMAFVALGAYLAANLGAFGWPLEAILPAVVVVAGAVGFVVGLSAGRFSVLYFGLLTLAMSLASSEVLGHWQAATGGDEGMPVAPLTIATLGTTLDLRGAVVLCVLLATLAFLVARAIDRGAMGRRWRAVKSQRIAAMAIGLMPERENAAAFALSGAMASLSGIGIAYAIGYLDPAGFDLNAGIRLIVGTVVGGAGSLLGAVLGAAFIVAVPELARGLPTVAAFVLGAATVATLLFLRRGIVPSLMGLWRARAEPAGSKPAARDFDAGAVASLARALLPPARAALVVENLSVHFAGVKALDGVGLTVSPGRTVGLIGPNGAGKTTFLNVLSGFYRPTAVTALRLGDVALDGLRPERRADAGLGRTFQHAELFADLTLRETLELAAAQGAPRRQAAGLEGAPAAAIAQRILDGLGLTPLADRYPDELPFGVQKVADVGRVLASGTSVIAMDEPFSGLDARERGALRTILAGMRQAGVSILIIDHAVQELMAVSDHVVVFEFGRLLAEGSPADMRDHPEVMRAYFGTAELAPKALEAVARL